MSSASGLYGIPPAVVYASSPRKTTAGTQEHCAIPATLTCHDLRHTAASIAISSGANVKAVQRMLGHKNAAMTLDTYADLFDTDLDDVATSISNRIAAAETLNAEDDF